MSRLDAHTRLRRKDDEVVAKVMDGEAVIINLSNGRYYSTDGSGAVIWAMIEDSRRIDEIVTALSARYEVAPAQAEADALQLVDQLLREELVVIVEGGDAQGPPAEMAAVSKIAYAAPELQVYSDMENLLALDPPTPGLADLPWKE